MIERHALSASGFVALAILCLSANRVAIAAENTSAAVQSGSDALQEVIVTAERREEKLSDVPMTVQAFTQEDVDQQGLRSIDDVARVSPGVTFLRSGSSQNSNDNDENADISIRGVQSSAGAATTTVYLDDTPIQGQIGFLSPFPFPTPFDIDRIEVLKGPQGTLFGASSEGGAIRFITPTPSLTSYSGYALADLAQIDNGGQNYEAGAAFGGPIVGDVLGFRVSASIREDGGWVNRVSILRPPATAVDGYQVYAGSPAVTGVTEPNANWHDTVTARGALRWQPTDGVDIEPSIYYQNLHINDTGAYWLNLSDTSAGIYNNGNLQRDATTDPWYLAALRVTWTLPWAELVSNTSYFSRNLQWNTDYSQWLNAALQGNEYPTEPEAASAPGFSNQRNIMEELRLSAGDDRSLIRWTGGLFFLHAHTSQLGAIDSAQLAYPGTPGGVLYAGYGQLVNQEAAVFGEGSIRLPAKFNFTAGVRYADMKNITVGETYVDGFLNSGGPTVGFPTNLRGSDHPVTPRFVLKYQPYDGALYYLSAAKGYRAGIAQLPFTPDQVQSCNGEQIPSEVAPDSVWQYELGTKQTLLEQHLQINAAAYYLRWSQIQQSITLACGYGGILNIGTAIGKGAEIAVEWRATEGLSVGFNAAYTDTFYQDITNGVSIKTPASVGDHLPSSPWNLDAHGEYVWNGYAPKPYVRIDYQFASAQDSLTAVRDPNNAPNSDPTVPGLPVARIMSIRSGVRFAGYDVSVYAQNLFNYGMPVFVARDALSVPANGYPVNYDTNYYGRGYAPRTIGLTAT